MAAHALNRIHDENPKRRKGVAAIHRTRIYILNPLTRFLVRTDVAFAIGFVYIMCGLHLAGGFTSNF